VSPSSRQPQRVAIPLTLGVAIVATAIAWYGTRGAPAPVEAPSSAVTAATVNGGVRSIVLPQAEIELPAGPHQREFVVACTTCHSARLVLNQPRFPRAKWGEIVQKMVKTFGAPISVDEEPALLDYLVAIRGK
jgi:cytochrome c553